MKCQETYSGTDQKWKLTNHGLESRNDEVIVIKRMKGQCMEDQ